MWRESLLFELIKKIVLSGSRVDYSTLRNDMCEGEISQFDGFFSGIVDLKKFVQSMSQNFQG